MTTTNKSVFKKLIFIYFLIFSICTVYAQTSTGNSDWIIAAEKFSLLKGQKSSSVTEGFRETVPVGIMEQLCKTIERNVLPDERFERQKYKLRKERQSLYLQLSSEYKKRDALVLGDYSEFTLKSKIKDEDKAIKAIQEKIDDNLKELKKLEAETEQKMDLVYKVDLDDPDKSQSEMELIKNLIKKIFKQDETVITQEKIVVYQNDFTRLYESSAKAKNHDYTSGFFENEMQSAGINTLLTGQISNYGDYLSISVDIYLYPGAKRIGSITEIGSSQELHLLTSSIANQIIPLLANAMPVLLNVTMTPPEAAEKCVIYVDDVIHTSMDESILLESGVHTIQFVSDGYRTAGTSYYFKGNTRYNIEVNFETQTEAFMQIALRKPLLGDIFVNGEIGEKVNDTKTQIKINGTQVLGEFIAEDGTTAFFYIPKDNYFDGAYVTINPKTFDREQYIDKRRRWMYGSYTLLILSLIPTFYTYGNLVNEAKLYNEGMVKYSEAIQKQKMANIFQNISIGCGVFFGFELVRYMLAANSVLPQKARAGDSALYEYYDSSLIVETEEAEETDEIKTDETEEVKTDETEVIKTDDNDGE